MPDRPVLTSNFGQPVADDQDSVTAGPRGPVLLQDIHLVEKLAHFVRVDARLGAGITQRLELAA